MVSISNKHNKTVERVGNEIERTFRNYVSLVSREVYDFYRENRRKPCKTIDQYNYFVKAVEGLFYVIAQMIEQSEGGVYIRGLGYFCCVKYKRKKVSKSLLLRGKEVDRYTPYFFPDEPFKDWRMDKMFKYQLRFRVALNKKTNHTLHFDICQAHKKEKEEADRFNSNRYK